MEFDLRAHLRDLSATPSVPAEAVPTAPVLSRIRRGRARRTAAVATVSAAGVLALGAVVYAVPWDRPEPPPAQSPTSTPMPTASPTPTGTPSPEPTPSESAGEVVRPTIVAVDLGGRLLELDPDTGAVLRQVAEDPRWTDVAVSPDRRHAYVTASSASGQLSQAQIQRVSMVDGSVESVAAGYGATVSPDGGRLAYLRIVEQPDAPDGDAVLELVVTDLASGTELASIPDDDCVYCERIVDEPVWAPDGRHLLLVLGYGWPPSTSLHEVDPETTAVLGDGRFVGPANTGEVLADWPRTPSVTADGTLLLAAEEATSAEWEAWRTAVTSDADAVPTVPDVAVTIDPTTGQELGRTPLPEGQYTLDAAPAGPRFVAVTWGFTEDGVRFSRLLLWNGESLVPLADDIAAATW